MGQTETLGLMLVRAGKITRAQLYEALKIQRQSGQRLGDVLFERDWIDEDTLTFLLAKQMGLPYLESSALDRIPHGLIEKVPAKLAREYNVLPVRVWKGKLHIALNEQKTLQYLDELSYFLGRTVSPHLVGGRALAAALDRYYPSGDGSAAEAAPEPAQAPKPDASAEAAENVSSVAASIAASRLNEPRAAPKAQQLPEPQKDETGRDFVAVPRADGSEERIFLLTDVVEEPTPAPAPEPSTPPPAAKAAPPPPGPSGTVPKGDPSTGKWPEEKTLIDVELPYGPPPEPLADGAEHTPPEEYDYLLGDGETSEGFDIIRAAERMFSTTSPDEVAVILVAFARHLLDRTILFDARDPAALRVWRHMNTGLDDNVLATFAGTPSELPLLKVVLSSHAPFFGPAPSSPIYGAFFERLGMKPPAQLLMIPIRALGEVIAIFYGDIIAGGREEDEFVDVQMLAKEAGTALDLLLSE